MTFPEITWRTYHRWSMWSFCGRMKHYLELDNDFEIRAYFYVTDDFGDCIEVPLKAYGIAG